jgi:hypothetical protein
MEEGFFKNHEYEQGSGSDLFLYLFTLNFQNLNITILIKLLEAITVQKVLKKWYAQ